LTILAAALVASLLTATGETGKWDLILPIVYEVPYDHNDVKVDRYHTDGAYQQATLAARELAPFAAVGERPDLGQPAPCC
jgi:hypothetical protein